MKQALAIFLLFLTQSSGAQQAITRLGAEMQYGFIMPHAADLIPISQSNPYGIRFSYDRMRVDKKSWDACNCFHYLGVQLSHYQFGNPSVLGHGTTLSTSFEPLLFRSDRWQISLATGLGMSYLNRVYDEVSNPENTFFSAPLSFLLFVSPRVQFTLNDRWAGSMTLHYNHISNGGQRQPNRGMNFPTLGVGMHYFLQGPDYPEHQADEVPERWRPYIEVTGTMKNNPSSNSRSPAAGISLGAYRQIGSINAFGGGWEATWDRSLYPETERNDLLNQGLYIAHHFLFGRFDFNQRMGVYVQKPKNYQPDKSFYQRYTLLYRFSDHLQGGASMKVHGHVAENIEFRIGYLF